MLILEVGIGFVQMIAKHILQVRIPLECKNDTNPPVVWELWVLEVGPGMGQTEIKPVNIQKIS